MPDTLTIAFFTQNHSIADKTGLLKTVSVYRLFGSVVTGSITSGGITAINGMGLKGSTIDSNFNTFYRTYGSTFNYALNTSNIIASPPDNVFTYGYTASLTVNNQYGAGITLASFYYNIFEASTLAFETPPANTAEECTIFGYTYNEQISGNAERDGKWIYTAFCPIDSTMNLNIADANIHFKNPQYPNAFTTGFPLESILAYAISAPNG